MPNELTSLYAKADELNALFNDDMFRYVKEVLLNNQYDKSKIDKINNTSGVYAIYYCGNKKVSEIVEQWKTRSSDAKIPAVIKSKVEKYDSNCKSFCLYLGSSERMQGRVKEHIFSPKSRSTYALRLGEFTNFDEMSAITIRILEMPNSIGKQYICQIMESYLRERLNPIIGRQ